MQNAFITRGAPASEVDIAPLGNMGETLSPPLLLQYWQIALRWKWAIVGIMVAALAIGLIVTLLATPKYTAEARIEINREEQNVTKVEGLESPEARRDDEFYQTQYSLLEARSLAERVARKLRLATNNAFFEAHGVNLDAGLLGSGPRQAQTPSERAKREELAIDLLLKNIRIVPIPRSRLVDVRYVSASPDVSADIANAWVQQFIEQTLDRRFASTVDARRFLEGRLADLGQRLEASERAVVNYASSHNIVSLGRTTTPDGKTEIDRTLVSSDLEALNAALAQATAERIAAESRAATGSNVPDTNSTALAGLRQRRAEAAAEYAKMLVQFEPGYPAAKALAQQVHTLDAAIAREEARLATNRGDNYAAAAKREAELRGQVQRLLGSLNRQQRDTIQYNIYQREADTNRQLYDSLLQRYKEIGVAGVSLSNISVVDAAQVPTSPSSPKLVLNLALAFVAGLGMSFLAVLGLEQVDEGLRDPGAVGRQLRLPLLGSVPDLGDADANVAIGDPKSELSEAYFSIQSNLSFSTDHGFPKSLMMTSSRPAEGKTTSSIALAVALARTGKKILLMDADMRSPSIHSFFDLTNEQGLSNFLAGDDNWRGLTRATEFGGLHVLSAGPMPPSAAQLLSGDRMRQLVTQLGTEFDNIVVDSPPILGLADAPLISRAVEGCAFVVEAEGVAVRGLKSALARLHQAHARIYGVLVTKINNKRAAYGYGYGYSYGYGSKSED